VELEQTGVKTTARKPRVACVAEPIRAFMEPGPQLAFKWFSFNLMPASPHPRIRGTHCDESQAF